MNTIDNILLQLPKMASGMELESRLAILPEYDADIRQKDQSERLLGLQDLYGVYIPSAMSVEIYSKLYLAMLHSLQKKQTKMAIKQGYENHKAMFNKSYDSIMGGSDSFTIIGISGIGKSSAVSRAIEVMTENHIIKIQNPYVKIIPCLVVQCPYDSSVKGMLLEILRKVDEVLGTDNYRNAIRARATTDMLIGSVSQICLNHIGLLVCDEIQHVVNSKNGKNLIGALTQLINNSGISICMVGTPEAVPFFQQAMQLARRSIGLHYSVMEYGAEFQTVCKVLFSYQYVKNEEELTDDILYWLYEHSGGVISIVVSLIHDAQEIAILTGKERLDSGTLNEAYQKRMTLLHGYIQPTVTCKPQAGKAKKPIHNKIECVGDTAAQAETENYITIAELAKVAKKDGMDMVSLLREHFTVEEVAV